MLNQNEIRESITNRIVESLKQGKIPWRRPWSENHDPAGGLPRNIVSRKSYGGLNITLLWLTQNEKGYPTSFWGSYQQWASLGGQVRKGERATQIIFYRQVKRTVEQEDGEKRLETFPLLRTWSVFNICQVDGEIAEQFKAKPQADAIETFPAVEREEFDQLVKATNADIRFGFDKAAYYRLPADYIVMPDEGRFNTFGDFADTLLHELSHWTEHRLGWSGSYSAGELRSELASVFLSDSLNVPNSGDLTNHAAYIQSWIQALENDPKHIFKASSAASKAADYLLGFIRPKEGAVEMED